MDPFTMALMGGSALQGISGLLGNILGGNQQSKMYDKAIQAQMGMQAQATQLQKEMLEKAMAELKAGGANANKLLGDALTGATDFQVGQTNTANEGQLLALLQARGDLQPYMDVGGQGTNALTKNLSYLTDPLKMDQATLESLPGYQFALDQGLRAQQQSATTRGLGLSGAQMKGAAEYATGLADQTYGAQFTREMQQRNDLTSRIMSMLGIGSNAAGQMATLGSATGADIANRNFSLGTNVGGQMIGVGGAQAGNEMSIAQQIAAALTGTGANIGGQMSNSGNILAQLMASQGAGQAGAITGAANAVGNAGGSLSQWALLQKMFPQSGTTGQPTVGQYGGGYNMGTNTGLYSVS